MLICKLHDYHVMYVIYSFGNKYINKQNNTEMIRITSTNTVSILNQLHLCRQTVLDNAHEVHRVCAIHLPKLKHRFLQLQLWQKHIVAAHLCHLVLHQSYELVTQRNGKLLVLCVVLVHV